MPTDVSILAEDNDAYDSDASCTLSNKNDELEPSNERQLSGDGDNMIIHAAPYQDEIYEWYLDVIDGTELEEILYGVELEDNKKRSTRSIADIYIYINRAVYIFLDLETGGEKLVLCSYQKNCLESWLVEMRFQRRRTILISISNLQKNQYGVNMQ